MQQSDLVQDDELDQIFQRELLDHSIELYEDIQMFGECVGQNAAKMFYDPKFSSQAISKFCANCIVRTECLHYALITDQLAATWGGFDERDRENILAAARRKMRETNPDRYFINAITSNEYMWTTATAVFDECAQSPVKLYASNGKSTATRKKKEPNLLVQ